MAKSDNKDQKKILLRLPNAVAKAVKKRAVTQRRSLNAQIIAELDIQIPSK